jgi:predicted metal-binding protein
MKMYVCTTCTAQSAEFMDEAHAALPHLTVSAVDCMSGCARAQTVAFRAQGKVAYLFGEVTSADLPALETFSRLYDASADGTFSDARVLGSLRTKAIARIPA